MNRREFLRNTAAAGAAVVAAPLVALAAGDVAPSIHTLSPDRDAELGIRSVWSRFPPLDVKPNEIYVDTEGKKWYWLYDMPREGMN